MDTLSNPLAAEPEPRLPKSAGPPCVTTCDIASWCDLLAHFMEHPRREETALVVLRRPGPAEISNADKYIYRVMREAAAGLQTAPWAFYETEPNGVQQVTEHNADLQPDLGSLTGPSDPGQRTAAFPRRRPRQLRIACP